MRTIGSAEVIEANRDKTQAKIDARSGKVNKKQAKTAKTADASGAEQDAGQEANTEG